MQKWKLACFDLDGTLVRHSTGQHLADKLGHADAMREIENQYAQGLASNAYVAALDGKYYQGFSPADIAAMLDDIPQIEDIGATVAWLAARGIPSIICTLAWQFVGQAFAQRHGFIASSGPTLKMDSNGLFTGEVASDFTENDKPIFVQAVCQSLGITMAEVFHIGDSRSDLPLFRHVGFSVALNANQQARDAADIALDSDTLLAVLDLIPGLKP
jgi:phosphoserine phosphatase